MAEQMRLLTAGLESTQADVAAQKDGLTEAKLELINTRATLCETQAELACAKARNAALKRQFAASEPSQDFDKPGNGEQHKFNVGVLNNLLESATALEENRLDDAGSFIKTGMGQLVVRNKHIRMADDSPLGWATVQEYKHYESIEDAEDCRKIKRAEEAVLAKKKRRQEASSQRGGRGGGRGLGRGRGGAPPTSDNNEDDPFSWFLQQLGIASQSAGSAKATPSLPSATVTTAPPVTAKRVLGPCYYCTGPHLQANCPVLKNQHAIVAAHQAHLASQDGGPAKS
jgi:hypothetical protein